MKNTKTNASLPVRHKSLSSLSVTVSQLTRFLEFPEQGDLIKAMDNSDTEGHIAALKEGLRAVARQILDRVFDSEGVNIVAAPADSSLCIHAAASGTEGPYRFPVLA